MWFLLEHPTHDDLRSAQYCSRRTAPAGTHLPGSQPSVLLTGWLGRSFLASLAFCSRCCCWSWLRVMPSLAACALRSAQSIAGGFSGFSIASSTIATYFTRWFLAPFIFRRRTGYVLGSAPSHHVSRVTAKIKALQIGFTIQQRFEGYVESALPSLPHSRNRIERTVRRVTRYLPRQLANE
jgi:hypothetical protein